ncbi:hypothetical protein [Nostoc sp.]
MVLSIHNPKLFKDALISKINASHLVTGGSPIFFEVREMINSPPIAIAIWDKCQYGSDKVF